MNDLDSEVTIEVRRIKKGQWLVLLSATAPFLVLAVAGILVAESGEKQLLIASTFIFAFGLALIATKVASHTAVGRHLENIKEINELKSDFIAVASHQLKTPISAFIYSLDGLESAYEKNNVEAFKLFLNDIKVSAYRLRLLTNNLLNVTLLNHEASTAVFEQFFLRPRVEEMIARLEPVRELHKATLDVQLLISPEVVVCCDAGLFYHVLENLMTNAFKYGVKEFPIILRVEEEGHSVKISISNKALSLKQSDIDRMFEKYKRVTTTKTSRSEGFGLGLYITKKFVESWGGTVSAELNDTDKVITFNFSVLKSGAPELPMLIQKTFSPD